MERGRMGRYEVADFVLLLNSYAISGEKTLADFFKAIAPVKEVMMGLWGRPLAGISKSAACPSASSLSRFLAAVTPAAVGGLRELFETDMGCNGVGVMQGIGMFDRAEDHYRVIDVDGTVSAARQRSLEKVGATTHPATAERQSMCAGVQRAKAGGGESNAKSDRGGADQ